MVSPSESAAPEAPQDDQKDPSGSRRYGRWRRAARWVAGSARVERAKSRVPSRSERQDALLSRARLAMALSRQIVEPDQPAGHGRGFDVAASLYRQSAYWSLLAFAPEEERLEADVLWVLHAERVARLDIPNDELGRVEGVFRAPDPFISLADQAPVEQRSTAELLRGFAERLLDAHDGPVVDFARQRVFRAVRIFLALAVLAGAIAFGVRAAVPKPVNLAEGRPWRTSTEAYPCHPEIPDCGGFKTLIFFHTREELNPWFEIDLGEKTKFSSMTIRNRTDFGPERAIPLEVQVSTDGKNYRTIATRTTTFTTWKPKFPTQQARYVRLRAMKHTFLHLEKVEVHP